MLWHIGLLFLLARKTVYCLSPLSDILLLGVTLEDKKNYAKKERAERLRELLPFWARELLAIDDEAERMHKVHESCVREDP
jgi:hypothetical protein